MTAADASAALGRRARAAGRGGRRGRRPRGRGSAGAAEAGRRGARRPRRPARRRRPRRGPRLVRHPGGPATSSPERRPRLARTRRRRRLSRVRRMDAITTPPAPINEPNLTYAPGSPERAALVVEIDKLERQPAHLPGPHRRPQAQRRRRRDRGRAAARPPARARHAEELHDQGRRGRGQGDARTPRPTGARWPSTSAAAIILKAADLLAGPWRQRLNAATMLGQSKTAFQAEIDAACELIDFWRFNVHYAQQILDRPADRQQPGHLEPHRPPPARGLRLRDHAVQLHRHRRQPADRAGADGQHRRLEAVARPSSSPRR